MWQVKEAMLLEVDPWTAADLVLPMQLLLPPAFWDRVHEWVVVQACPLVIQSFRRPTPPCVSSCRALWLGDVRGKLRPSSYLQRMVDGKAA